MPLPKWCIVQQKAIKAGLTFQDSYNISLEGDD